MRQLWPCISADFKQRTRQQSFAVSLLAMVVLTLLFFPAPDAQYQTLVLNGYRGIYNSAWLGVCLAMLNVLFLPLICFYLVKNALELDRQSQTSELIAATPISATRFLFAKWCVNLLILVSVVFVMLLSTLAVQLYYGESYHINVWALVWPQLVYVFPMMLAVASVAIMFESVKWLRGGLGNIVYFFLWIGFTVQAIESLSGIGALLDHLETEVTERFPSHQGATNIGVTINDQHREIKTFVWQGIEPTFSQLTDSLLLYIISLACLLLALVFFDRFSQNSLPSRKQSKWFNTIFIAKIITLLDALFMLITKHLSFTRLLRLELKLLLKGHSWYWIIGLFALNITQLLIEQSLMISVILPLSWLWCVLVISPLGQLEKQSNTLELITYAKQSSTLQSLASFSAAWLLLLLASVGSLVRFSAMNEGLLIIQLVIAISFTASLAFFCGAWTGNKRMFEVLYPTLWYIGPIQAALYVDFFGVNSAVSWQAGVPYYFLVISVGLLALTVAKRNAR
ncbi:hypothetical protein AAD001_15050 [Colwelliaceae bacterium 6471]